MDLDEMKATVRRQLWEAQVRTATIISVSSFVGVAVFGFVFLGYLSARGQVIGEATEPVEIATVAGQDLYAVLAVVAILVCGLIGGRYWHRRAQLLASGPDGGAA